MKTVCCFILLFIICQCAEDSTQNQNAFEHFLSGGVNDDVNGSNLDSKELKDHNVSIIRPCSVHDTNCIRLFFAQNFQCLPTEGTAPDVYVLPKPLYLPIPQANLTYILNNAQIRGLNQWKIEEFFINKATHTIVLEIVFNSIVVACPEADLIYHRKGKEQLKVSDYTIIDYKNLSFTLTVPYDKDNQLSNSHVYTYIPDIAPKYTIGPATYTSKDPGFIRAIIELEQNVSVTLKEVFVSQGPVIFSLFLENCICDFRHY